MPTSLILGQRSAPFSGLWIAAPSADYLFYDDSTSPLHRENSVLHELGHLLFDHRPPGSPPGADRTVLGLLLPDLSAERLRDIAGAALDRTGYTDLQEREAELFAARVWQRAGSSLIGATRRADAGSETRAARRRSDLLAPAVRVPAMTTAWVAVALAVLLLAAGTRLTGLLARIMTPGPLMTFLGCRLAQRRALTTLYPLWASMCTATPGVALDPIPPRWQDRLRWRDLDYRLYRRVIEMWDARRLLGERLPEYLPHCARTASGRLGLRGAALDAAIEAASINAALRCAHPHRATRPAAARPPDRSGADLTTEVAWWGSVAVAFQRCRGIPPAGRRGPRHRAARRRNSATAATTRSTSSSVL